MSDLQVKLASNLRDYYSFLLKTLPRLEDPNADLSSYVHEPPDGGWPDVTSEVLAILKKTDYVVEILRHLPHFEEPETKGYDVVAADDTYMINYGSKRAKRHLEEAKHSKHGLEAWLEPIGAGVLPEHVVALTSGGKYAGWWLLDTEQGTITNYLQFDPPERDEPDQDSPDHWRAFRTLPIDEFFEEFKQKFLRLEWVLIPDKLDDGIQFVHYPKVDEAREIYLEHGWPDDFNRQDCREALLEWDK